MYTKKVFFYIVLFFFVFNTNFVFLPLPTITMIATVGLIVYFLICFMKNSLIGVNVKILVSLLSMILFSVISMLVNNYIDLYFYKIEIILAIIIPFIAAFYVAYLGRNIIGSFRELIKTFVIMNTIQGVIVWIGFFSSPFKEWLLNIQRWDDRTRFIAQYGGRLFGIGMRFDYGAAIFSLSLISIMYLFFSEDKAKPVKYLLIYIFQMVAGWMVARSIIIGILCSVLFFIWISYKNNYKLKIIFSIIVCFIIAVLGLYLFSDKFKVFIMEHQKTFMWMFEFFYADEFAAMGKTTNSWSTIANDMYYIPNDIKTILIGTGYFESLKATGYKNTDPLYMKYLMYFGVLGVGSFLFFYINTISTLISKANVCLFTTKKEKILVVKYFLIIAIFILFMYAKSNCHCFIYIYYLYFYFVFYNQKMSNTYTTKLIR